MTKKKINSEEKENIPGYKQRGSALVLTVIVLVNALLIVAAISTISVMERKMSSRAKNSTPAFQAADSGAEWVLYKIGASTDPMTTTLATIFPGGDGMDGAGIYDCRSDFGLAVNCEVYFVDKLGEVVELDSTPLIGIDSVRVVGKYGEQEDEASRALEVMIEIAHCPPDFVAVGDFCIMEDQDSSGTWLEAVEHCASNYEARLCRASEWVTACELDNGGVITLNDMTDGGEWVDDLTTVSDALTIGNGNCTTKQARDIDSVSRQRRCCINLQQ